MTAYIAMLLLGAAFIVWTMSLIAHRSYIVNDEAWYLLHARRTALTLTALGMLWAAHYTIEQNQMPEAPDLLIVGGIDLYLVLAIVSAYRKPALRLQRGQSRIALR